MEDEVQVIEAIDAIIEGRNVERFVHDLILDGKDLSGIFKERLSQAGYTETTVGGIVLGFDERVPAFLVRGTIAYFGWIFRERFTEKKDRQLFGSVAKNGKGDWSIQVPFNSTERVFARLSEKLGYELDGSFYPG